MTLSITRIRKVHQLRKIERAQSAAPTTKSPIYHQALWSCVTYSSACHEIGWSDFAIS